MPLSASQSAPQPETWSVRITDGTVATLTIPGSIDRTRRFDVDVQLQAKLPATFDGTKAPELGLSLEIDGAKQWSRTVAGSVPGEVDNLEYHCRLVVEPGRDTRLRARATVRRCALQSLTLSAVEDAGA